MPPKGSKTSPPPKRKASNTTKPRATTKKTSTLTLDKLGVQSSKSSKPLSGIQTPLTFNLSPISPKSSIVTAPPKPNKGKGKVTPHPDDQLWVDQFAPTAEAELAVHKRKVEDVRQWLTDALDGGPGGRMRKYRRVLALTGPAGVGKTATIRVLAKEFDIELVEWRSSIDDSFANADYEDYESLALKFQNFLDRASAYHSLSFGPSSVSTSGGSTSSSKEEPSNRRQLILMEDLPNVLHAATREAFHATLMSFATSDIPPACPIVFIISNNGVRGDVKDERGYSRRADFDDGVDVRSVIPPGLFHSPYFIEIQFNPIAITLLRKGFNALVDKVFATPGYETHQRPTKEVVEMIISSAHGDIRSAAMALQFACVVDLPSGKGKGKAKAKAGAKGVLEAITHREQSLALFHLLGKLLYNKRYGDPEETEEAPYEPRPLPPHLRKEHERRLSKVDVNVLYADSPVDTSLLSLYVHQNYTQFCNDVDECDGLISNLSMVDTLGEGDAWPFNASLMPHAFHTLALGTLHSLPSPVRRRSQKTFKPQFFESLSQGKDTDAAVADVRGWMDAQRAEMGIIGGWSRASVIGEAGVVLQAMVKTGRGSNIPANYATFAHLPFQLSSKSHMTIADENETGEADAAAQEDEEEQLEARAQAMKEKIEEVIVKESTWLEDDDIVED